MNPNDPAFTNLVRGKDHKYEPLEHDGYEPIGLTKREYFAAMAMQGLIMQDKDQNMDIVAPKAIWHADRLIAELSK